MENTDAHWRQWGKFDPYRGVLFQEKYKQLPLTSARDDFFETGRHYVQFLMEKLTFLYPDLALDTAVDFGCGVGRLLIPLAGHFQKVIGVDISHDMLLEARKNCGRLAATNTELVLSDDLLSRVPHNIQLVHSFLVLQHIRVERGLVLMRRLAERLAPAGVCALHVPIERKLTLGRRILYFSKHSLPGCRYMLNILQRKPVNEPLMQMNPYPLGAICDTLDAAGMRDLWVLPIKESQSGVICFGRKCA
jgi:SAM-dependent methyltransferase